MSAQQSSTGGVASRISIGDEMYLAYSHVRIGDHFYYGLGVQQDYEIAAKFYLAAANKENPEALFNLGYMYHTGIGIPKDFPLAKRYIVSCRALTYQLLRYGFGTSRHWYGGVSCPILAFCRNGI